MLQENKIIITIKSLTGIQPTVTEVIREVLQPYLFSDTSTKCY